MRESNDMYYEQILQKLNDIDGRLPQETKEKLPPPGLNNIINNVILLEI